MKIAARQLVSQSCISELTRLCGCWKSIFPHLVVCTCSFYFPRGNTCNQLMNCCLCIQLSLRPRSGKGLIKVTGMCLQMHHWDANSEPIYYCFCRFFFQKANPAFRRRSTDLMQRILPFGRSLMAKTHSYIPPLSAHSNFPISSPQNNSKKSSLTLTKGICLWEPAQCRGCFQYYSALSRLVCVL